MADAAAAAAAASSSPSLDFLSPEFDALEALRCEGLQPPNPRVRPLDNLNKCLSILPQELSESFVSVPVREPRSQESIAAQQRAKARTSLQMEKAAERARQTKVLDAMAEKLKDGPLGLLVECYEKRGRVLVWTRHAHGIRGTLVGFLLAVDKHFNMVLQDVDEQYTVVRRLVLAMTWALRLSTCYSQCDARCLVLYGSRGAIFDPPNKKTKKSSVHQRQIA
ncbi:hypothetical protein BDL97_13G112800 [Sphagnum fallax]|nr:hypothetical protein BDL97_13G112800 [Sphagnum fallax]